MSVKVPAEETESRNRVITPTFSLRALDSRPDGYCVNFFYYNAYMPSSKGDRLRALLHIVRDSSDEGNDINIGIFIIFVVNFSSSVVCTLQ